jgi:uncharacterized protein YuzE
MKVTNDVESNTLYIELVEGKTARSIEVTDDVVADFDRSGTLLGIEVLDAKSYDPGDCQRLISLANAAAQESLSEDSGEREPPVDDLEVDVPDEK